MNPTYPRILPDRDEVNDWYLDEDVTITLHNSDIHLIKKGFKFDSHSVPPLFRPVFPRYVETPPDTPNDIYAALVHDYLIACEHWLPYNRAFVDYEYRRFHYMPEYFISSFRRKWMPLAVTKFGKIRYGRKDYRGEIRSGMFYCFNMEMRPACYNDRT